MEDYQKQVAEKEKRWKTDDYESYKKEHIAEYQKWYSRVEFDIESEKFDSEEKKSVSERLCENADWVNGPKLAVLFLQYARYLLLAGSRPHSQAMNLQGIWNDRMNPPWASNYTTNINIEMNYWPSEVLALPECQLHCLI